jgi:hypothetical protein
MTLLEVFKSNRPDLSQGSLRTYVSILKNLALQMNIKLETPKDVINNYKSIVNHLKDVPPKNRKTRLSALVVFIDKENDNAASNASNAFRHQMTDDGKESDKIDLKQELTSRQKEGMMSWEEVMKKYNDLEKEVSPLLKKEKLDKHQFNKVQMYVILSCMLLIPPRRSLDWVAFKLRNYDKTNDNYFMLEKRKPFFIFNVYKTAKKKGQQKEEIPTKLWKILQCWNKLNPHDYLIMNSKQSSEINATQLTNMLYQFFDKPLSTSLLRHIYLSNKYKDMPALKEMMETADNMGQQDIMTALKYVKKDMTDKKEA